MICFITGGARSGKSSYAQKEALQLSNAPVYIATSRVSETDEEFAARIKRHQNDRDQRWTTLEVPIKISEVSLRGKIVVIDCVTLWLSNFFSLHQMDVEKSLFSLQQEIDALQKQTAVFFIVSNEIGMGVHAATEAGRKFTDLQGWANQYIAAKADKVVLMISGIPVIIKETYGT